MEGHWATSEQTGMLLWISWAACPATSIPPFLTEHQFHSSIHPPHSQSEALGEDDHPSLPYNFRGGCDPSKVNPLLHNEATNEDGGRDMTQFWSLRCESQSLPKQLPKHSHRKSFLFSSSAVSVFNSDTWNWGSHVATRLRMKPT